MSHIVDGVSVLAEAAYSTIWTIIRFLIIISVLAVGSCSVAGYFAYKYITS